jgi:REP-associated tyrosine transposase
MAELEYKDYTQRNLPHFHPRGATIFVTFRLAGSIPQPVLRQWKARRLWLDEEIRRISDLKLENKSPELEEQDKRLREFTRVWFSKFEYILHRAECGPVWLKDDRVARIVVEALHHRDERSYRLDAYCLMSNHVHAVFKPLLPATSMHSPLSSIMKTLKGYTAFQANRVLGRSGAFWERESFDHAVRNAEEFDRIVRYVLNNPVKAGLVTEWQQWKWTYRRKDVP